MKQLDSTERFLDEIIENSQLVVRSCFYRQLKLLHWWHISRCQTSRQGYARNFNPPVLSTHQVKMAQQGAHPNVKENEDRDIATLRVIEELKRLYKTKILPLEQYYRYDLFQSPHLTDAEFDSKPQVMLVGQYSVGKTSFIRYLLGRDFPGQRIGPEPTTDRFTAVMSGPDERIIPGNALAVSHDLPYRGLERFGVAFLNRFEGAQLPSDVLKYITLVDTPGVLSGEKQRVSRGYDFCSVTSWFGSRADLILLLFDAHKLDISDEFRNVIESLKGNDDKIRCILNKADQVDRQKLMRVYGALMWSLGKVVATPEVLRVYIGSFWSEPLAFKDNEELFEMEKKDLLRDLKDLPRNSALRKINELCKRVRLCKVHSYVISYLKEQMPNFMGHQKKQKELISTMDLVFRSVLKKYNLAPGDFPHIHDFKAKLEEQDFTKFHSLKQKLIDQAESVLAYDIPRLMEALPKALDQSLNAIPVAYPASPLVFDKPVYAQTSGQSNAQPSTSPFGADDSNPWADDEVEVQNPSYSWELQKYVAQFMPKFNEIQVNGLVSGGAAKGVLKSSGLPVTVLKKLWDISDIDRDGSLDLNEFVIAMYLAEKIAGGGECPTTLPDSMIPPDKKH